MLVRNDVETNFEEYFVLPNPSLRSMFGRIKTGSSVEYRTRFYNPKVGPKKSVQQILNGWMDQLESVKAKWPGLWNFEMDLAKKVGPMSIMKPLSERMDDIDSYYSSILLDGEPISEKAERLVIQEWSQVSGLRIRGQKRTVELMKKSTSSGSPYYRKKRDVVGNTVPCDVYLTGSSSKPEVVQVLPDGTWKACAILGWRGQEGGPTPADVKQRVVFMFPFSVNVCELQLYQPLVERAQALNLVPAWVSMEAVDDRITRLFDSKSSRDVIVCTDFTKFDQHFNSHMQDCARRVLSALMTKSEDTIRWLDSVFPIKYNIPLAYEWGYMRFGAHGMGSGSGGTNADETIAHRALQYEAALRRRKILNPNSMCLGDDGILTYPGITAKDVTLSYSAHGLDMNIEKQSESLHECTYLRRWHHENYRVGGKCVGVYSTCRALGRLAEQERWYDEDVWGPKAVALRQLSILENVKYHPLREEFVQYCMKGDRYRLGLDIPGFFDNLDKLARSYTALMPEFLGYTRSLQADADRGINNWWVVNYIKSLK
nr:MAG: RNA-dependent RNA polymerase [Porcine picobirnavirus]